VHARERRRVAADVFASEVSGKIALPLDGEKLSHRYAGRARGIARGRLVDRNLARSPAFANRSRVESQRARGGAR